MSIPIYAIFVANASFSRYSDNNIHFPPLIFLKRSRHVVLIVAKSFVAAECFLFNVICFIMNHQLDKSVNGANSS